MLHSKGAGQKKFAFLAEQSTKAPPPLPVSGTIANYASLKKNKNI